MLRLAKERLLPFVGKGQLLHSQQQPKLVCSRRAKAFVSVVCHYYGIGDLVLDLLYFFNLLDSEPILVENDWWPWYGWFPRYRWIPAQP